MNDIKDQNENTENPISDSFESEQKPELIAEPTIGNILKTTRENLKINISEISKTLKIKEKDIIALEKDDIVLIASHLYVPGFIKSYGRILKIDNQILERKVKELNLDSNVDNKKHRLHVDKKDVHSPNKETFFNAVMVFTVLYLLLFSINQFKSENLITAEMIVNEFNQIN